MKSWATLYREGKMCEAPRLPGDDLFERTARERRIAQPKRLLDTTDDQRAESERARRAVYAAMPAWAWCPFYVQELARDHLPRVMAWCGVGPMLGRVSEDPFDAHVFGIPLPDAEDARLWGWRWVVQHAPLNRRLVPIVRDERGGDGMVFHLRPASDANRQPRLFFDEVTHEWWVPSLDREGASLIELAAWLRGISHSKAAHGIARLCGRQRPVP